MRLDRFVALHFGFSRQKSIEMIKNGSVLVNENAILKPSFVLDSNLSNVRLDSSVFIDSKIYCSRAAFKLKRFLENTECMGQICLDSNFIEVTESIIKNIKDSIIDNIKNNEVIDVGASSGGFTQVLLLYGARGVLALDVGDNQLDSTLLNDSRVISLENTDIRDFVRELQLGSFQKAKHLGENIESTKANLSHKLDSIKNKKNALCSGLKTSTLENLDSIKLADLDSKDSINESKNIESNLQDSKKDTLQTIRVSDFANKKDSIKTQNLDSINLHEKIKNKPFKFLTCDVSFISLRNILESLQSLSDNLLLLFKPQFEAGKHAKRDKKGVLKDAKEVSKALESFLCELKKSGCHTIFVEKSQLSGKAGNEEFFILCRF